MYSVVIYYRIIIYTYQNIVHVIPSHFTYYFLFNFFGEVGYGFLVLENSKNCIQIATYMHLYTFVCRYPIDIMYFIYFWRFCKNCGKINTNRSNHYKRFQKSKQLTFCFCMRNPIKNNLWNSKYSHFLSFLSMRFLLCL